MSALEQFRGFTDSSPIIKTDITEGPVGVVVATITSVNRLGMHLQIVFNGEGEVHSYEFFTTHD